MIKDITLNDAILEIYQQNLILIEQNKQLLKKKRRAFHETTLQKL